MVKKQFTLYLENKPGALAKVTKLFGAEKINIEGISVADTTDVSLVQLVVDNATRAKTVLTRSDVPFTVQDVAVLTLPNKPGALGSVAAKLAKAGVNINYLYSTTCEAGGGNCTVVISGDDLSRIERLWS